MTKSKTMRISQAVDHLHRMRAKVPPAQRMQERGGKNVAFMDDSRKVRLIRGKKVSGGRIGESAMLDGFGALITAFGIAVKGEADAVPFIEERLFDGLGIEFA